MTSQIDYQSIDKTFPVAGQDNDTQGFRDNFDVIQRNFQRAKDEIEDLQSKALLRGPLTGTEVSGTFTNDLGGSIISNGSFTNFHGTSYAAEASGSRNISLLDGPLQAFTVQSDTVFTFTDWPDSGNYASLKVHLISNSPVVNVGNDIELGKRYTIDSLGTTNWGAMGASPSAVVSGTITEVSGSRRLTVSSGQGDRVAIGSSIIYNGTYYGTVASVITTGSVFGLSTTPTNTITNLTSDIKLFSTGTVFVARDSKGTGTGTVKPWHEVTFDTEGQGVVVTNVNFSLPVSLDPNPTSNQVVEAWTWTGSTTKRVFLDYVGTMGTGESSYNEITVGTLIVSDTSESTLSTNGSAVFAGGVGIARNLNVGGSVLVEGDLTVNGSSVLTTSSVTIQDIGDIQNVVISNEKEGDSLKWNGTVWTNTYDIVDVVVAVRHYDTFLNDGTILAFSSGEPGFTTPIPLKSINSNTGETTQINFKFEVGKTYRFDCSDPAGGDETFAEVPAFNIAFSRTPDTVVATPGSVVPYTDNVTTTGNIVEITITPETPCPLYIYVPEGQGIPDTNKYGGELPFQVGNGPAKINAGNYTAFGNQNIVVDSSGVTPIVITLPYDGSDWKGTDYVVAPGTFITVTDNGNADSNPITVKVKDDVANSINGNLVDKSVVINGSYNTATFVFDGVSNWTYVSYGYNGSDQGNPSTDINLDTTVTYLSTEDVESYNLSAGAEGQVKIIVMKVDQGNATVTVANAGWHPTSGSSQIIFDTRGDSVTLQFVEGAWYVVGNNGCEIGGVSPTEIVSVPFNASSNGKAGQISYDTSYLYVCVADNTWKAIPFVSAFGASFNEGTTSLNDLTDVNVTDPIAGQVLEWSGTQWINAEDNV